MNIKKISHIGIAVRDLHAALHVYQGILGMELLFQQAVPDQGVRVAMLKVGASAVELLHPLSDDSPVARFLQKRGEGVHHVAYEVADLDRELLVLAAQGVQLVDRCPRVGANGKRVAFVHPHAMGEVLTELCEVGGPTVPPVGKSGAP